MIRSAEHGRGLYVSRVPCSACGKIFFGLDPPLERQLYDAGVSSFSRNARVIKKEEAPAPDNPGGGDVVRHQGIEPRTH